MQKYVLTKIIDISLLNSVQELISKYTGMPCVFSDSEGHFVTKRSNSCQFCDKLLRKNNTALELCEESLKRGTMQALVNENVNVYTCHAGLVKVVAPIMLEGIFIGSVSVGGVLYENSDDEVDGIAKKFNLNKADLESSYNNIKKVTDNDIENVVHILDIVSFLLSNIALNNFKNDNSNVMYEKNIQSFMLLLSNLNDEFKRETNVYKDEVLEIINTDDTNKLQSVLKDIYNSMEEKAIAIDDTLEYAKMSSGQLAVNEYEYCPEQMINILCNTYGKLAEEKNVIINCNCKKDLPDMLLGDAGRISQIINKILYYIISITQESVIDIDVYCERKNYANLLVVDFKSEHVIIDDDEKEAMFDFSSNKMLGLYNFGNNNITLINQIIHTLSGEFSISEYNTTGIDFMIKLPQLKID